jgi:hypothetical protein
MLKACVPWTLPLCLAQSTRVRARLGNLACVFCRHKDQEIVCRTVEGPIQISTYADLSRRAKLCAIALMQLGVG